MMIAAKQAKPAEVRSDCVIAGVFERGKLSASAEALDAASRGAISAIRKRGDLPQKVGQVLLLHNLPGVTAARVLLVGGGKAGKTTAGGLRRAIAAAASSLNRGGSRDATLFPGDWVTKEMNLPAVARRIAQTGITELYTFNELKSDAKEPSHPLTRLTLAVATRAELKRAQSGIDTGRAIGAGVNLARDLGNRPANVCTPSHLAEQARNLKKGQRKVKVSVLDEKQMNELGMGSLLSVSRGSNEPAKLIVMEYRGGGAKQKPVALVGKGVTFDTGGISIKPAATMDEMKFDMCGAASVFGVIKACIDLELPANVVGIVPATENMPGGKATKPGDIVTSMSGQTIEILNTDAEGRLILADALSYAERFKPDVVIDIATLTGACVIALGEHASGLLSNNDALAKKLLHAGEVSDDRCWQLPLWKDYQEQLNSNFADMANVGGRSAGTITAACFLSRFTEDYRWAHLDIAGTAWLGGTRKGATGRPVPLLVEFLLERGGRR